MVVAILGKGDLVGCDIPFSLIPEALVKSSSDVKALTYCDLKSIHISGLLDVLKLYPEFAETFCTEIIHDLTFNLREGHQMDPDDAILGVHSMTLPSISEDDEDDGPDADDDHEDDSGGSGSPPSSPPMGAVTAATVTRRRATTVDWDNRRNEVPLISSLMKRPALKFSQTKTPSHSKGSRDRGSLEDDVEATRSNVERLDSQLNRLNQEMLKLSSDVRLTMTLLQKLVLKSEENNTHNSRSNQSGVSQSCDPMMTGLRGGEESSSSGGPDLDTVTDRGSSHSLMSGSCSQIRLSSSPAVVSKSTKQTQTERLLLEDLLAKITDSGSPPPNSGYSSSSSNEEKVKYLTGAHCPRGTQDDSESISDDSVLRPSHSLNIQSMTSSRDVSPFKGSRNSWNTPFGGEVLSPLPSPRPPQTSSSVTTSSSVSATSTGDNHHTQTNLSRLHQPPSINTTTSATTIAMTATTTHSHIASNAITIDIETPHPHLVKDASSTSSNTHRTRRNLSTEL